MKLKAVITQVPFLVCPACGVGEFRIGHIVAGGKLRAFGPWYCDSCGGSFTGEMAPDGQVWLTIHPERKIETIDVLVLKPHEKPVYFIVEGMRFAEVGDDADECDSKHYFYEEHSCPTNWLKPSMVYYDGDSDPHGLIEFVATRDRSTLPPDEPTGPNDYDEACVALIEQLDVKDR